MRFRAWWIYNDKYRDTADFVPYGLTPQATDNLIHLYDILKTEDIDDRIMKAGVARALGRFEECLDILNYSFPEKYLHTVTVIRNLALKKVTHVKELK